MFDFDLDFDIVKPHFDEDLFLNTTTKKRIVFDLHESFKQMQRSISAPLKGESIRMISPAGGWSSCTLLMWLCADREVDEIVISTLRVGKKEMDELCKLNFAKCFVILSGIAKENGK